MKEGRIFANLIRVLSLATLVIVWWVISLFFDPTFIPGPLTIFREVYDIFSTGEFLVHMYHTLLRVFLGFIWAFIVSIVIGVLMGTNDFAEKFFDVEILVGLTIPGLAWAMISLIWFRIRDFTAIFAIFIVVLPIITVNMWEGTKALDKQLMEMGQAFRANKRHILAHIVIPQLVPYLFAATRFGFAIAWKVVVVAEMLGLSNGIGFKINHAFGMFSMEGVLAWTLSFTLVMIILEFGLIKVIENRVTRWRPKVTL